MEKQENVIAQLEESLSRLKSKRKEFITIAAEMAQAYEGALYAHDLFANAVIHRSMGLINGFVSAIESRNFICAAPLVRMHLDNLLRYYATYLVESLHDFSMQVLSGKSIRNIKDMKGYKMTDRYLVETLKTDLPWIEKVYNETCSYVHLSDKHIFNTVRPTEGKENSLSFSITGTDNFIPDKLRLESALIMEEISIQIIKRLKQWVFTKNNPNGVKQI